MKEIKKVSILVPQIFFIYLLGTANVWFPNTVSLLFSTLCPMVYMLFKGKRIRSFWPFSKPVIHHLLLIIIIMTLTSSASFQGPIQMKSKRNQIYNIRCVDKNFPIQCLMYAHRMGSSMMAYSVCKQYNLWQSSSPFCENSNFNFCAISVTVTLPALRTIALALPVSHHWLVLQGNPNNLHQSHLSGFSSAFPATHTLLSEKSLSQFWAHKPVWISASCTLHVYTNTEPCSSLVQTKSDVATFSAKAIQTLRTRSRSSVRWHITQPVAPLPTHKRFPAWQWLPE